MTRLGILFAPAFFAAALLSAADADQKKATLDAGPQLGLADGGKTGSLPGNTTSLANTNWSSMDKSPGRTALWS